MHFRLHGKQKIHTPGLHRHRHHGLAGWGLSISHGRLTINKHLEPSRISTKLLLYVLQGVTVNSNLAHFPTKSESICKLGIIGKKAQHKHRQSVPVRHQTCTSPSGCHSPKQLWFLYNLNAERGRQPSFVFKHCTWLKTRNVLPSVEASRPRNCKIRLVAYKQKGILVCLLFGFLWLFQDGRNSVFRSNSFSTENFTWKCVNFTKESATINIRFPKINKDGNGDYIDIFKTKNTEFCPFTCLKVLSTIFPENVSNNLPVFTFDSGKFLTVKTFSETIKDLLRPT